MADQKVLEGAWNDNISWEFYLAADVPDRALCQAVYTLAIIPDGNKVVLTRIGRGWEMLGGHLEPGETIEEALVRECLEEGGFTPEQYWQFGYMKITAKEPVPNDHHGGFYPQLTYMPHFVAISSKPLVKPTGEEVLGSGTFSLEEAVRLDSAHEAIIRLGMEQYAILSGSNPHNNWCSCNAEFHPEVHHCPVL